MFGALATIMKTVSISPATKHFRFFPIARHVYFAAGAGVLLIAFLLVLWRGPLPFEALVQRFAKMDNWADGASLASQPALLRKYYSLTLAAVLSLAGLTTLLALLWSRLNRSTQAMLWRAACTLSCTCALCVYLSKMTYDGPWSPVDVLMSNPSALPVFGHRLLFVWLAKAFHAVIPSLSPMWLNP